MNTRKKTNREEKETKLRNELGNMQPSDNSSMVYDNAFKTMSVRIPKLNIPLINELFGTHYSIEDKVEYIFNEDTKVYGSFRIEGRRSDAKFQLHDKRYHLECESTIKGDTAIRLFEYDWVDAVHNLEEQDGIYVVCLQNSGVLYLRTNCRTPKKITYKLILPGDMETEYHIPIVKNLDYSLDQIFEKQLYMLLPYYILKYEKMVKDEHSQEETASLLEDDMTTIFNELTRQVKNHVLSDYEKNLLYQLIWNVSNQVFSKNQKIKGRMANIMGGQVLEFPWDIEYRKQLKEARDEGLDTGRNEGGNAKLISQICRKLTKNKPVETIADELEEDDVESIRHICEVAAKYAPEYDVEKIYKELYPSTETA